MPCEELAKKPAPSLPLSEPNKKRDQDMQKAIEAQLPKTQQDTMVAGFEKYRTFVGNGRRSNSQSK
jgi:hypothetical protein